MAMIGNGRGIACVWYDSGGCEGELRTVFGAMSSTERALGWLGVI